ncbi:hypothetical protein [Gordonia malaquae]|uniref:hypothetical protein n=1 Tax=Gordonia malaquae TaxID=410332 RepID=UPI0030FE2500
MNGPVPAGVGQQRRLHDRATGDRRIRVTPRNGHRPWNPVGRADGADERCGPTSTPRGGMNHGDVRTDRHTASGAAVDPLQKLGDGRFVLAVSEVDDPGHDGATTCTVSACLLRETYSPRPTPNRCMR